MNNPQLKHFHLDISEIDISISDVEELAKMGEGMPSFSKFLQDEMVGALKSSEIQGGYVIVDAECREEDIIIGEEIFHIGASLIKHFNGIDKLALFVCTAGIQVSERAKELNENGQLIEAYLLDVLGSVMVEKAMDKIQEFLNDECEILDSKTTNRYSPGYGQWHMQEQVKLFSFLPPNYCGIKLSDSCLMTPAKSLSGFIGIGKNVRYQKHVCQMCNSLNCLYRNSKNHC